MSHTSPDLPLKSHEIIVLSSDNKDDDNKGWKTLFKWKRKVW
jgi:hypothetical protein